MAKRGKTVVKTKVARKTATRAKVKPTGVSRKPTSMDAKATATNEPLDAFIDSVAQVLELHIEPQWRAAIKANLAVTLRHGALVNEFALPDEFEPAPVFEA